MIDQRSEKALGEEACTMIATLITGWLLNNRNTLPLRCEFDKLIRDGSTEIEKPIKEEAHKDKFIDQHFHLDMVIQAQVRPLEVVSEKSDVDFFRLENTNEKDPLQDAMSFDSIWEEIQNGDSTSEECVCIVSWNDHFFVLKIEKNTMYIIDTLGERLTKGCDKAYLLKFNEESITHNVEPNTKIPKAESEGLDMIQVLLLIREKHKKENNSGIICKGTSCCKEIIKGILTTIPLGELQSKVERGINGDMPLHQLLQIEFHHVSPLQQKLFGPSVVVLLKGHCKQRISNTRRARYAF